MMTSDLKILLDTDNVPNYWYNVLADLKRSLPPPLDPSHKGPIDIKQLERLFPKECIKQEI